MKRTIRVRRKTRTILGRLYIRYTCDACGRRSGWRSPQAAKNWYVRHGVENPVCLANPPSEEA